ncbi:VOC family protein [Saccharicrinis fermentans]|uniref:Glyoxalase-like domain protein n=1 Tax=Saccharicrinis fermentans DSM 9555 = JCM 21142 TaxID=869213 RepID=W7YPU6_9BACT|nr:VOC family protein [Saccharicrinis fermentans]GAF04479.1 glyoxalase-like domain protein [Saccharicrinis fermentans DSM 9555 = JCM 21142]
MEKNICGIQQIGVGVKNAKEAWKWYRSAFGMDINVFEDTAVAKLMLPYTNGQQCERYAALAMNMEGGGGFEIWQHTGIEPKKPVFDVQLGDCGIFIAKMKCRNVHRAFEKHREMGVNILGALSENPVGQLHYFMKDPYDNIFEVVHDTDNYMNQKSLTGGNAGAVIGVSDIEEAKKVYLDILQYNEVIYDKSGVFEDFKELPGGDQKYRRVLLKHKPRTGPFSKLLGPTQIELVQALERRPRKIFQNRIWGELGFIHLCFDIMGMEALKEECKVKGFPFTVNSADSFDMGVAAGHFSYISDPDGTPIEFVETHKLPIVEKLGWYMNLKGRNPKKSLPNWMIKTLLFSRVKD